MKISRLIAIVALIWCGQTILAMDMNTKITQLLERIPTEDIMSDLPESLFEDLPNPSRRSADEIIEKKSQILHRYLALKEKYEKYGCTLPYDATRSETLKEQRLTTALTRLDKYYQQFIRKIREHGADTSFLEQAKRLNIHDDNVSPTLAKNDITSKWALVETINSDGLPNSLLTLPLQAILQDYMNEAPVRAQWIQRALNKLDELKRKQDELKNKTIHNIKEKIAHVEHDIQNISDRLKTEKQVFISSTDPQASKNAQDRIYDYTGNLQEAMQKLNELKNELKLHQTK